ncbi:MAG: ATP-binding protein [Limnospira sp. PMC 894.15]|uniref:ATP-binding protein n=1 Tax=unclassified Limnospira TaxID=2642885 RepID=UPI0028E165B0|nr:MULTISPECIES: ATP-binding protein [unclassified Limnospira]MDT9187430.1 ATP-binding protein [Limnospira sp. PMC 894.15]MDT9233414.1 ATP-binding protein [Limnospira sp. PMC 917.15]
MEVQQIIEWADGLVLIQTGKHLDDLETAILQGTYQNQKYSEIAAGYNCSEPHAKKVAYLLWKTLSQASGEEINKSNLRSTCQRLQLPALSNSEEFVTIDTVTQTNSPPPQGETMAKPYNTESFRRIDRTDIPNGDYFCDRQEEVATLKNWILQDRSHLVSILGLSGIGKTAVALHLLPQIQDHFDCVIWRSLRTLPSLSSILTYLTQFLPPPNPDIRPLTISYASTVAEAQNPSHQLAEQLSLVMESFRQHRCLLILDDVQAILNPHNLVGGYKPGYESYRLFFKTIGELSHNSCLIMNSSILPQELIELTNNNHRVKCLTLAGLGSDSAHNILTSASLLDADNWQELIDIYGGNPGFLKIVSRTIKEFFGGSVKQYLANNSILVLPEIKHILDYFWQQLSDLEKQVMGRLSASDSGVSMADLLENTNHNSSDLLLAVQSLQKRFLVDNIQREQQTLFTLIPVIREYTRQCR